MVKVPVCGMNVDEKSGGDHSSQTVFPGLTAAYGVGELFAHLQKLQSRIRNSENNRGRAR